MSTKLICDECGKELVTNDYFCCHDCLKRMIKDEEKHRSKSSFRDREGLRKIKDYPGQGI